MWRRFGFVFFLLLNSSESQKNDTTTDSLTVTEPWHILNISISPSLSSSLSSPRPSSSSLSPSSFLLYNLSLSLSSFLASQSLCESLSLLDYELEECLSLSIQSHRTLRLFLVESYLQKLEIEPVDFSRILAYSYFFENCPTHVTIPIDICFFGEFSPSVLLTALLSCDSYRLKLFNIYSRDFQVILYQLRQLFPKRFIRWIPGTVNSVREREITPHLAMTLTH